MKTKKSKNLFLNFWNWGWEIYHKNEEIWNYLIVGAIGVVISTVSFLLPRLLGQNVVVSNIISWIIAVVSMYVLNKIYVFKTKCQNKRKLLKEFFSFILARVLTFFIETWILSIGIDSMHVNDLIVKIVAQIVVIVLNYVFSKVWIFNKTGGQNTKIKIKNWFHQAGNYLSKSMMSLFNSLDKKSLLAAFVVWIILNITQVEKLYFADGPAKNVIIIKTLHLIFLYVLFSSLHLMYAKRKTTLGKRAIVIAISYFAIMFLILLMIWPGTWSWDDILVFIGAKSYKIVSWQHFLSQIYIDLCLQTLPFAGGVIIIQLIFYSMAAGYVISRLSYWIIKPEKYKYYLLEHKKWPIYLCESCLLVPFLLPVTLEYAFSGFRIGIYSILEITLLAFLYNKYRNQQKIRTSEFLVVIILAVLVCSWRTEGIFYVLIVSLLLLIGKLCSRRAIPIFFVMVLASSLAIGKINTILIGSDNYTFFGTVGVLDAAIDSSNIHDDSSELAGLNKVVDVQFALDHPELTGEQLGWSSGFIRTGYSSEDFSGYKKSLVKLSIKHLVPVIKKMGKMFLEAAGVIVDKNGYSTQRQQVPTAYDSQSQRKDNNAVSVDWYDTKQIMKFPLSKRLQEIIFKLIACECGDDWKPTIAFFLFRNLLIPLFSSIFIGFYFIKKKKWFALTMVCALLIRTAIIFVTEPAPYIMYYLPVYLIGYELLFAFILSIFLPKKIIKNNHHRTKKIRN